MPIAVTFRVQVLRVLRGLGFWFWVQELWVRGSLAIGFRNRDSGISLLIFAGVFRECRSETAGADIARTFKASGIPSGTDLDWSLGF